MSLFTGIYTKTLLNTSDIPQADLNIANKSCSNPLRWNGQFSPQLVQVLLNTFATPETVLFDPFLGSGTVLLEAGLAGLSASGTEINPAAVTLAKIYKFINVPLELCRVHLREIGKLLQREFLQALPLFQDPDHKLDGQDAKAIKSRLVELLLAVEERLQLSTSTTAIDEIIILRKAKRLSSNIRGQFNTAAGRRQNRTVFTEYLQANPFSVETFSRFLNYISRFISDDTEDDVLARGYF